VKIDGTRGGLGTAPHRARAAGCPRADGPRPGEVTHRPQTPRTGQIRLDTSIMMLGRAVSG